MARREILERQEDDDDDKPVAIEHSLGVAGPHTDSSSSGAVSVSLVIGFRIVSGGGSGSGPVIPSPSPEFPFIVSHSACSDNHPFGYIGYHSFRTNTPREDAIYKCRVTQY
jgi:hypothetical protein